MARLALAILLLLTGWCTAQLTSATVEFHAAPGDFLSIPVSGAGNGSLDVQIPAFVTLVGSPALTDGFALVNLLLGPAAPAGEHAISVSLPGAARPALQFTLLIAARPRVELRMPEGETVVQGDAVEYTLQVTNSGNAPERVLLTVDSRLEPRLSNSQLELAAGESREVVLQLNATRAGDDTARVRATIASDPDYLRYSSVRTTVLPFAGADQIDGPSLRWRVATGASHGSSGLAYALQGQLAGELSDFIDAQASLALRQRAGGTPGVSGRVAVAGTDWRVSYRGSRNSHRFDGSYQNFSAFAGFGANSYSFGTSYRADPFIIRLSHSGGSTSRQQLTVGYRSQVTPTLSVTPALGVERISSQGDVRFGALFTLDARLQLENVLGAGRIHLPLPAGNDWRVILAASSRSQTPLGLQGELGFGGQGFNANFGVNRQLTQEVTLQGRVAYTGRTRLSLGVRYRPHARQLTLGVSLGVSNRSAGWQSDYRLNAEYAPGPFSAGGFLAGTFAGEISFGARFTYQLDNWNLLAAYEHGSHRHHLSLGVESSWNEFTGFADYQYDFLGKGHELDLGAAYRFPAGHSVFAAVGLAEATTWRIGADLVVQGGFATPPGVVGSFGGRAVGFVTGTVFHDLNRNGQRDAGEPSVADVTVTAGRVQVRSGPDGQYLLPLAPGLHALSVTEVTASYGLQHAPEQEVSLGETHHVDLPLQTVVTAIINVFDDRNRNGTLDDGETPLPLIGVIAQAADGSSVRRTSNIRGEAVFQQLIPGPVTFTLDQASLPRFVETTTDPVTADLQPGPLLRLELGATEREKEIRQTLAPGDLTMIGHIEPAQSPPGADVLLTVRVQGNPLQVTAETAGTTTTLQPDEAGVYSARVSIPGNAAGLLPITLHAENAAGSRQQQLPLVIRPGPLGTIEVQPTLAGPGEELRAKATLLTIVEHAWLVLDGEEYELQPTTDPYTFETVLTAPQASGSQLLELHTPAGKVTETRFLVQ